MINETFDYEAIYRLMTKHGLDDVEKILTLLGIQHKAVQEKLNSYRQERYRAVVGDKPGGPADDPRTPLDESVLVANDVDRLELKRRRLGVRPEIHRNLLNILGADVLERVYNRAGANATKALEPDERDALIFIAANRLLPEAVDTALSLVLGDSERERVIMTLRDMSIFGPGVIPR